MRFGLCFVVALGVAFGGATAAWAQTAQPAPQELRDEIDRLRREFDALRREYGDRLAALDARLATLEGRPIPGVAPAPAAGVPQPLPPPEAPPPAPTQPATPQVEVPVGAAGAGGPSGALPIYGNVSALSKIFNPDIAVIGDFLGAAGRNRVEPSEGFEMHEVEATLQAIVDPYARADFFFAFGPEEVEVEEAFVTFPTLPGGLLMKAGKMRASFGKVNTFHNHVLSWTDRPRVIMNLVGGDEGISDAGVSVSRLILNPWVFLEATGEVFRGTSELFHAHERDDLTYVGRLRGYQDLTEATNLDIGTSIAYGRNEAGSDFATRLVGLDATFRYRPLQRAIYQRFLARTELVWSRREQPDATTSAFGWYAGADYQFARRWFAGVRYDQSARPDEAPAVDGGGSFLLTFWPSEFSQIRGQYRRMRYAEGHTANELLFQFLFSIGAHGAHQF